MDLAGELTGAAFSVPFLGRAYDGLLAQHRGGLRVSLAALQDFSPEENSRLSAVAQRYDKLSGDQAFLDCVNVILEESRKKNESNSAEDLMALSQALQKNKGYGGT